MNEMQLTVIAGYPERCIASGVTEAQARKIAVKEAAKNNGKVFVSGYNGQCAVYYNRDGYGPTGKAW
jgi:hypothetical protein